MREVDKLLVVMVMVMVMVRSLVGWLRWRLYAMLWTFQGERDGSGGVIQGGLVRVVRCDGELPTVSGAMVAVLMMVMELSRLRPTFRTLPNTGYVYFPCFRI